jgi:hypothetical protein
MPERFILAQTTLIVVPQLLIAQWLSEAKAHLEPGVLKIFTMGSDKKLPPIEALIRYDVSCLDLPVTDHSGHPPQLAACVDRLDVTGKITDKTRVQRTGKEGPRRPVL